MIDNTGGTYLGWREWKSVIGATFMQLQSPNTAKTLRNLKNWRLLPKLFVMIRERQLWREAFGKTSPLMLPAAVQTIAEVDDLSARQDVEQLAAAFIMDRWIAHRILPAANLAVGSPRLLMTVAEANTQMGWENLRSLALGLAMFAPAPAHDDAAGAKPRRACNLQQMWEHALGCAMIGGAIGATVDPATRYRFFMAGFLHDIGRVLLYHDSDDGLTRAMNLARETCIPATEAETLVLGQNHVQQGALWSRAVDLNPMVQCAILHHHRSPATLSDLPEDASRLAALMQLTDSLFTEYVIGVNDDTHDAVPGIWEILGLREKDCRKELCSVKIKVQESRETFGFGQPEPYVSPRIIIMPERNINIENSHAGPQNAGEGGRKGRVIPFPKRPRVSTKGGDKATDKKLTILVVEDHGSLCDMLSLYFMRYGYHVRTANDGVSALQVLHNEEIHLILLDLMLPRMDGFTVLRQIRERSEGKPPYVIVVSAGASTKDKSLVMDLGANEYMPKPFHLLRLLERIQNVEKYLFHRIEG